MEAGVGRQPVAVTVVSNDAAAASVRRNVPVASNRMRHLTCRSLCCLLLYLLSISPELHAAARECSSSLPRLAGEAGRPSCATLAAASCLRCRPSPLPLSRGMAM